ncbi:nucleoside phosphatase family-domain-containing protein [Piptocephalis cylindrospora]|uniref:guanosine-diphosphatase n=1 Tax=Piptocephalis cylindrospora TaxID=1907219 RepID=A0A4P9Y5P3_9FUNG|nr:nucleoside phosphatase family-domain-containing protein [Piptocephalis cylindrospora]|eukprot:RKP14273.1 nucleoside phosphatase family-domain-containing protein [Piptocephalis cylindrospora]
MVSVKLLLALSLLSLPVLALAAPKKHDDDDDDDSGSEDSSTDDGDDASASDSSGKTYGIIMDAGSGGTRAFAYSWSEGSPDKVETVMDDDKPFSVKLKPGLSSTPPGEIKKYMGKLIDGISKVIPKSARAETTVQLMATAGLRLLPGSQADNIIAAAKSSLISSPFKASPTKAATIITGAQEGVYGWMALNSLSDTLGGKSSIAAIAMGGSSTQITFSVPSTALGLMQRVSSTLTPSLARGGSSVKDPCGLKGDSVKGTSSKGGSVTLSGTGDVKGCLTALRATLGLKSACTQKPCAVQGAFQPEIPSGMSIQATNNFADLAKAFGCDSDESSAKCLLDATAEKCPSMSADEAKDEWAKDMDDPSLVCFQGMFAAVLLIDGFHIPADRPITFSDDAGDVKKITYTLGAMMASLNPSEINVSAK